MSTDATLRFYDAKSTTAPLCVTNHVFDQYSNKDNAGSASDASTSGSDVDSRDDGTGTQKMPRKLTLEVCDRSIGQVS